MSCQTLGDIVPYSQWVTALSVDSGDDFSTGTVDLWVYSNVNGVTIHKTQADGTLSNSNKTITFILSSVETGSLGSTDTLTYPNQTATVTYERNGSAFTPIATVSLTPGGLS